MTQTKTLVIPNEHFQKIIQAYLLQLDVLPQPYADVVVSLPVAVEDGNISFDITYENFL